MQADYDIAIIGGGMTGAALACALSGEQARVAVIDAVSLGDEAQPSYDARGLSLSLSSQRILAALDLWPQLAAHANPLRQIHVSERGRFSCVRLRADALNLDALGYVVLASELGRALLSGLAKADNINLLCPARVSAVTPDADAVRMQVATAAGETQLRCKLLVVADGTHSAIRAQLGIKTRFKDYGQSAIVANITPARPHRDTAYERFTASGPFALLPLPEGRCVAVYTATTKEAKTLLALDEAGFLQRAGQRFGKRLGRFIRAGARKSYPLTFAVPQTQIRARLVLLGNAAHTFHPNGAQGFNLSLRDVAGLVDELLPTIRAGGDPGASAVLTAYTTKRAADQRRIIGLADGLSRLFYNHNPAATLARNLGMLGLELAPALKKTFMREMMGLRGAQPEFVRGRAL